MQMSANKVIERQISKLTNLSNKISNAGDIMKILADEGAELAKENLNTYGMNGDGPLAGSIKSEKIDKLSAKFSADGGHAIYVEYGTGIVGKQNPHKLAKEKGIKYDRNEHKEDGWVYPKDDKFYWTMGQPSKPFMYKAAIKVKKKSTKIIREQIKGE